MRTSNQSGLSDALIKKALKYLKTQFHKKIFNKTEIIFINNVCDEKNQKYITGCASEKDFGKNKLQKHIYLIEIAIGNNIKYPSRWVYRKSVSPPMVKNHLENLIFTLAHELEHIDQFMAGDKAPYFFEKAARH